MTSRPVILRALAERDVDEVINFYLRENAESAALGFIDVLEKAYAHIGRHPASGSTRYAEVLQLTGLRSWPLANYPHIVFYIEQPTQIDVWRVLHGHSDIPAWLSAE